MARRKKSRKKARARGSAVKAELGHVIKSLQSIKRHVNGQAPPKTRKKRASATKTLRSPTLPPWSEKEPMTLDSPTLRRPGAMSYPPVTLRSPVNY
jgi:hypothetical protein